MNRGITSGWNSFLVVNHNDSFSMAARLARITNAIHSHETN
jgi:hypothetical protein